MHLEPFFAPVGDAFDASIWTRGPWSPEHQHAGPPAALLGRAIERALGAGFQVVRIAFELPRPVPIGRIRVAVTETRSSQRVRRLEASLHADDKVVMTAAALAMRVGEVQLPPLPSLEAVPPTPPATLAEFTFPFFPDEHGYHRAMELRFARGGFGQGRATAWMRPRVPLVVGEEWTPLQRVLVAADSGNGISNILDSNKFLFVNADLSVHLHRLPSADWVCLDAYTAPEPEGIGIAHSRLFDERGPIGHAVQSLFIAAR